MQTFTKQERLSSKVAIDNLFESGKQLHTNTFEIRWLEVKGSTVPIQIVISVPKRLFKKAVDRNKVKRLFREAYRRNKFIFLGRLSEKQLNVMFIYKSKKIILYKDMEKVVIECLQKLVIK